jgi:hypothetical protein
VASLQSGNFHWGRYWLLLGSSVLVVAWLNLRSVGSFDKNFDNFFSSLQCMSGAICCDP